LRRTRAEQVADLLPQALQEFPVPSRLADATVSKADVVFRAAGLRSRIHQLHEAAKEITARYGGEVPLHTDELLSLPGVGPYVASIVASRLSGSDVVLVDTNSVRVAARVLGVQPSTKEPRRERQVIEAVRELLGGPTKADDWFHVIDLAHLVCRPKRPDCGVCPLAFDCRYVASGS
jgi:A/G-specific adenine glycosylase